MLFVVAVTLESVVPELASPAAVATDGDVLAFDTFADAEVFADDVAEFLAPADSVFVVALT